MNQQKIWGNIAEEWNEFRKKPMPEVIEFLKNKKGRILDAGCGSGRHLINISKGKMYSVDFSEKMIEMAKKKAEQKNLNAEFFISDITNLPFKNNFFDCAICISALHCIEKKENRKKTLKELFRVLKPDAESLISVWNKKSNWFKNPKKENCIRWRGKGKRYYYLYETDELETLLEEIGFKIIKNWSDKNIFFIVSKKLKVG